MAESLIAVVDLGSTNTKVSLLNQNGQAVSTSALPTPVIYGKDTMSIDVSRHWKTVLDCCRQAIAKVQSTAQIEAVSISTMAASFVPLDKNDQPLMSAIGWSDARSKVYTERYMERFLKGQHIANCGQYPLTMYAGFKLQLLQDTNPELFSKIRKWLNVSEYIYHRLLGGGEFVTDYPIASRTMLFDVHTHTWNPAALDYFQIDRSILPNAYASGTVVGTVGKEAQEAGFSANTKVILGGHDHMCALVGAGVTKPGIILDSTGTSESLECLVDANISPESMVRRWLNLECSSIEDKIAAVNYVGATGLVYNSTCNSLLPYDDSMFPMPEAEPMFLPPQRAQLPTVRGELLNIPVVYSAQQLTRAIRDGLFYECRRGVERLLNGAPIGDTVFRCVGGHVKYHYEMQLKADALGCPIEIGKNEDIASKGAFILAGYGCGWFDSVAETAKEMYARVKTTVFEPDPERSARYNEIYHEHYLPLFPDGIHSL